jgi:8-oxo-dGTP pyrophosphatase MutT (NUDIX family)
MDSLVQHLSDALARTGASSSDFDLNKDFELPKGRVLRPAGVLVAVVRRADQWQVVLTKRSSALKHHPGQIAFAGGKQDPTDADVVAAALREAREEIGLTPESVKILGTLPDHETVTGFQVTPVLGLVRDCFQPVAEQGEVDEVFFVPLDHVMSSDNYLIQSRLWQGRRRHYYVVPYGPYYIWGATARILRGLAERMKT